jgi:transposase
MEPNKQQRLSAEAMRAILARFASSGLTVTAFCRREGISASSFYRWRTELGTAAGRKEVARGPVSAAQDAAAFVDLGTLHPADAAPRSWRRSAAAPGTRLMFFPEGQIRVFLYGKPADLRKSFDGLQALTRHAMEQDPLNGSLYVFVNRRGTQIRVLYFDRSGFCLWSKRLEAGRFISDWRTVRTREMNWTQLKRRIQAMRRRPA